MENLSIPYRCIVWNRRILDSQKYGTEETNFEFRTSQSEISSRLLCNGIIPAGLRYCRTRFYFTGSFELLLLHPWRLS